MNTQELFDKVAGHLLAQNERSLGASGRCKYRGMEGKMCAIGCLIDGDHYDVGLEGQCSDDKDVEAAIAGSIGREITQPERRMLRELQRVHDNEEIVDWPFALKQVADKYGLEFHYDVKAA